MAKRSYPTSEVRDSGREYQSVTAQERPRRATPHLRSGAATRGDTPRPKPEAKGGGREEQPHVPGAVAARAQEGLEELFHVEGQKVR